MARSLPYKQLFLSILVFSLLGLTRSDFASDRAECADKLVVLATCLPFLQAKSKVPTADCCSGFKQLVDNNRRCLCILVKDRNNPQLGYAFNVTLALQLPKTCTASVNATECIDLLHLSPNSTEAQDFRQIARGLQSSNAPSSGQGNSSSAASSSSQKSPTSDGKRNKLLVKETTFGVFVWYLVSTVILGV